MNGKVIEMNSSKGHTDTHWIKEWNNACDRIPLTRLRDRKGDKNDTVGGGGAGALHDSQT
jgi:hypothetical protein